MSNPNLLYLYETASGLGHQRRAAGIVNGFVANGFDANVGSGTFVDAEAYFDPRVRLIKLPAPRKQRNGTSVYYNEHNVLVPDEHYNEEAWKTQRVAAIDAFAQESPLDAILVEWWPFNRRKEFGSIINAVLTIQRARFGIKPLLISSIRDVLEFDDHYGSTDKKEVDAIRLINEKVDAILIHGDPTLVPFEDVFRYHAMLTKPIHYTGYVVSETAKPSTKHCDRDRSVYVSCGSGDNGQYFLRAALRAMPHTQLLSDHEWNFVLGPRMESHHRQAFHEAAAHLKVSGRKKPMVRVHDQLPELPKRLADSQGCFSLSGYNTTMEALTARTAALLAPKFTVKDGNFGRIEMEQWKRLLRIKRKGMAAIINPPKILNPHTFASLMDDTFSKGAPSIPLNMDGARTTAHLVEQMVRPFSGYTQVQVLAPQIMPGNDNWVLPKQSPPIRPADNDNSVLVFPDINVG